MKPRTRVEKTHIARGVTAQIVSWPPDNCFYYRRPIVFGARWVELVNDNERLAFIPIARLRGSSAEGGGPPCVGTET
jgi:hypothetical protein